MKSKEDEVCLSFEEIEKIVGVKLPASARNKPESFWTNTRSSSQGASWINAGHEVDLVTDSTDPKLNRVPSVYFRSVSS